MGKESSYPILEIYHPSISAGDTAIIVTRSNDKSIVKTVLIDLGCNTQEVIQWCNSNIDKFKSDKNSTFDYVIISHYHQDHYAGIFHASIQTESLISSFVSDTTRVSNRKRKYSKNSDDAKNPPVSHSIKTSKVINLFNELGPLIKPKSSDITVKPSSLNIDLGPLKQQGIITLQCICANGIYRTAEGKFKAAEGDFSDWNDHSIAWLLEYKGTEDTFRYFTAGDLSGSDTGYTDIESLLIPFLKGKKVNVLKATHHGSKHSLTFNFLNTIKPDEIIVPCNHSHLLPFPQFFERVYDLKKKNKNLNTHIYLVNYLNFEKEEYNSKFDNVDQLKKMQALKTITPAIKESKNAIYTAIKDENSMADLPCFVTNVNGKGKSKTESLGTINLKITAPSHGSENLPELYGFGKFAEKSFEMVKKFMELNLLKFSDVFTVDNVTKRYKQKQGLDKEIKKSVLSGYKKVFPNAVKDTTYADRFLKNPVEFNGVGRRYSPVKTFIKGSISKIEKQKKNKKIIKQITLDYNDLELLIKSNIEK